jgi:hypothetical protein
LQAAGDGNALSSLSSSSAFRTLRAMLLEIAANVQQDPIVGASLSPPGVVAARKGHALLVAEQLSVD